MDSENHNPFASFWMAGFECTDQLNVHGDRVDFLQVTQHLKYLTDDYAALGNFQMVTVREGIRWSQVERSPYQYDWSILEQMVKAGRKAGIQQIWDLCHFGYPDDLSPLHPKFIERFVSLCKSFVTYYRLIDVDSTLIVVPVNEASFVSWLGGEAAGTSPWCHGMGWDVKYRLMAAFIAGVKAMRELDPGIRILTCEPLVNMVPPLDATPEEIQAALQQHEYQFQVPDMLTGRICEELGGQPDYLDIIGVNYYYNNQWIAGTEQFLGWGDPVPDPRWRPLHALISEIYERYRKPVVITETSHPKEHRPQWIRMIGENCRQLLRQGVPLWGVCIYPIIDRPDWNDLSLWHRAGLWDIDHAHGHLHRVLYDPFAEVLVDMQQKVEEMQNASLISFSTYQQI